MMKGGRFLEQWEDCCAARATLALSFTVLLLHGLIEWWGGHRTLSEEFEVFGLSRDGLRQGRIWQVVSYAFLHGSWLHVTINVLALVMVGARLERIGGFKMWAEVGLIGILGGAVGHLLFSPSTDLCLVGLSGGIMGAMLFLTGVSPESRLWPLPISGKNLGWGLLLSSAGLATLDPRLDWGTWSDWGEALDTATGGVLFHASHGCHFGGAVAGMVTARWLLRPRVSLAQLQADRRRREGEPS